MGYVRSTTEDGTCGLLDKNNFVLSPYVKQSYIIRLLSRYFEPQNDVSFFILRIFALN